MENGKRGKGPRGGLYQHCVMVRLAATEKDRLEYLSRQKMKAGGTLAREMITDALSELFAVGTPLRTRYDRDRSSKRRNTPIERAARAKPAPTASTVELVPTSAVAAPAPSVAADKRLS